MSRVAFPAPREMTRGDVEGVIRQFVDAARLMADAGFSGVELHGAHGYLIGMFLIPDLLFAGVFVDANLYRSIPEPEGTVSTYTES